MFGWLTRLFGERITQSEKPKQKKVPKGQQEVNCQCGRKLFGYRGRTIRCPVCSHTSTVGEKKKRATPEPLPKSISDKVAAAVATDNSARKERCHALAVKWWKETGNSEAACDDCSTSLRPGEGYLCNPANLSLGLSPDLVCERCFNPDRHEPWNREETARKIGEIKKLFEQ